MKIVNQLKNIMNHLFKDHHENHKDQSMDHEHLETKQDQATASASTNLSNSSFSPPLDDVEVNILPTPNPHALKFIINTMVKIDGKSTYTDPSQSSANLLAQKIFQIPGVDTIHFFQNVITVNKMSFEEWDYIEAPIVECIKNNLKDHNPHYQDPNPAKKRRENLSPELIEIEEILDRTIRPGLQGDGGDLTCIDYNSEKKELMIQYEGACGTCPSSTEGTLEAIRGILKEEYHPEISVFLAS